MSMNHPNSDALEKDSQEPSQQERKCGCCSRKWRCIVLVLLAMILLGGGAIYWSLYLRVYRLDVCQSVMKSIQTNKELLDSLGQPIELVYWPSRETVPAARIEESEIDVLWNIEGPKGRAKAHARAERRQGQWQTIVMDVVLPGGKKVLLAAAGDDGNEAPPADFTSPKPETKKPEANSPPPEINLPVPPGGEPGK
jgi:hypothetical protein